MSGGGDGEVVLHVRLSQPGDAPRWLSFHLSR